MQCLQNIIENFKSVYFTNVLLFMIIHKFSCRRKNSIVHDILRT